MNSTPASAAAHDPAGPVRRVRFHFPPELDEIPLVAAALRAFIAHKVPQDAANAIELGVVEALTNLVQHGYEGMAHTAVELQVEESPAAVVVSVLDSGRPIPEEAFLRADGSVFDFDPADLDQLPVGGMGLSLIKESFDHVSYAGGSGVNRLTMAKRLPAAAGDRQEQ